MANKSYTVAGIMSGTSLDGVDIALCSFLESSSGWHYKVIETVTVPYNKEWKERLENAWKLDGKELTILDRQYGAYIASLLNDNILSKTPKTDLIASHGHTVFHAPHEQYTLQIGHGSSIAALTGVPVVYDFRSLDIEKGGQGAPLVPVGDKELFGQYDACLNLGGFSNISFDDNGVRKAFDICPVNFVVNHYANQLGKPFDIDGNLGRQGKLNVDLLNELNGLAYYSQHAPKSLAREWVEEFMFPIINKYSLPVEDILCTLYKHIDTQISVELGAEHINSVLLTGGGALNKYLLELFDKHSNYSVVVPDREIIEFKEAIIFAFLGLLRYLGRENCYASVTGARSNSVCGVLVYA